MEQKLPEVEVKLLTLEDFLNPGSKVFTISSYQRSFEWEAKHVDALLETIIDEDCHFLGNFIIHEDRSNNYVVDGQQRLICFLLILSEMSSEKNSSSNWLNKLHYEEAHNQKSSSSYLKTAMDTIQKHSEDIPDNWTKMYIQQTTVRNLDLAFTFFDAQNTAGKRALSKDLLKARHLQKMWENKLAGPGDRALVEMDELWNKLENYSTNEGETLTLTYYLFSCLLSIRRWARGESTPYFHSEEQTDYYNRSKVEDEFASKRILKKQPGTTHFAIPLRTASLSFGTSGFLNHTKTKKPDWLGHMTMPLESGELFFRYIDHYHKRWRDLRKSCKFSSWLSTDNWRVLSHTSVRRLDWITISIAVYLDDLFGSESQTFQHLMEVVYTNLALYRIEESRVQINHLESLNIYKSGLRYINKMLRNLSLGVSPDEYETAEIQEEQPIEDDSGFHIQNEIWRIWKEK